LSAPQRARPEARSGIDFVNIRSSREASSDGSEYGASLANLKSHEASFRQPKETSQMGILTWIVLGLIAGFIASKIVDHRGSGLLLDIALGVVGALVGGYLFSLFGAEGITGLNIYSMFVAVIGAVVVLFAYNALMGRRST
jgi:uncharacterized membrane protein YeaQ/YmgE (transglycosylase-associated protein family)